MINKILGYFKHKKLDETHDYWKKPNDSDNDETLYLDGESTLPRSEYLLGIVKRYFSKEAKILELGCNVGRNLNYLFQNGYNNISGIEINASAVALMRKNYPEMMNHSNIMNGKIEDYINSFKDKEFDLIYTIAVLEHIHTDSEWIFEEMVKKSKYILTIEDEGAVSWRHFPRNYKKVFKKSTMIESSQTPLIPGFTQSFKTRLFLNQT